eukprot:15366467-Ditylum_brightwellii.AAC.1
MAEANEGSLTRGIRIKLVFLLLDTLYSSDEIVSAQAFNNTECPFIGESDCQQFYFKVKISVKSPRITNLDNKTQRN